MKWRNHRLTGQGNDKGKGKGEGEGEGEGCEREMSRDNKEARKVSFIDEDHAKEDCTTSK